MSGSRSAVEVTGYASSPGYGLRIDLHSDAPDETYSPQRYSLGPDGRDTLYLVDVARYGHDMPGKIGQAMLTDELIDGRYEATYEFSDDQAIATYGHRGIMTSAMVILLSRVREQDINARQVVFDIEPENYRSIGLATKLGAAQWTDGSTKYYLPLPHEAAQHV